MVRTSADRVSFTGVAMPCRAPTTGTMPLIDRFPAPSGKMIEPHGRAGIGHQCCEIGNIAVDIVEEIHPFGEAALMCLRARASASCRLKSLP